MKKILASISFILLTHLCHSQASTNYESNKKIFYIVKAELGISQLELLNRPKINGNLTQIDFLLSNRISDKYKLEYGLGFSQFNGNNVYNGENVDKKITIFGYQ